MSVQQCGGSDDKCPCRRNRKELDDAKEKRVNVATANQQCGGGGGGGSIDMDDMDDTALATTFKPGIRLVHYDAALRWVCSECGHKIGVHPEGGAAAVTAVATAQSTSHSKFSSDISPIDKFTNCVSMEDYEAAHRVMVDDIVANLSIEVEDDSYCVPRTLDETWARDVWQKTLATAAGKLCFSAKDVRASRVIRMHAGSGCGKTHALCGAPLLLEGRGVYITFNQQQNLLEDKKNPVTAILLRVYFRLVGMTTRACPKFLGSCTALTEEPLHKLIAHRIAQQGLTKIVIGVDECRLVAEHVSHIAGSLGALAVHLHEENITCISIMAALDGEVFSSVSDRHLLTVELPLPNGTMRNFVAKMILGDNPTEQQMAVLAAAGGHHFRSLVEAADVIKREEIAARVLWYLLRERLRLTATQHARVDIRAYMTDTITIGNEKAFDSHSTARLYADNNNAIAPALVFFAFEDHGDAATKMFDVSSFVEPTKQLECCGYDFDRFRCAERLPVVPFDVRDKLVAKGRRNREWFEGLKFVFNSRNTDSLFASTKVNGKATVVSKHVVLTRNEYYFPTDPIHPWIDRACVATGDDNEECLVLYQDKINKDLSAAVKALNRAAKLLMEANPSLTVLCVAQVLGASDDTTAQNKFEFSYLLIRTGDVSSFYSPTFAPALQYVRDRHVLGPENSSGSVLSSPSVSDSD